MTVCDHCPRSVAVAITTLTNPCNTDFASSVALVFMAPVVAAGAAVDVPSVALLFMAAVVDASVAGAPVVAIEAATVAAVPFVPFVGVGASVVVGASVDDSAVMFAVALSAPTIQNDTDVKVSKKESRTANSDIAGIEVR